jgi:hypothetical protein
MPRRVKDVLLRLPTSQNRRPSDKAMGGRWTIGPDELLDRRTGHGRTGSQTPAFRRHARVRIVCDNRKPAKLTPLMEAGKRRTSPARRDLTQPDAGSGCAGVTASHPVWRLMQKHGT